MQAQTWKTKSAESPAFLFNRFHLSLFASASFSPSKSRVRVFSSSRNRHGLRLDHHRCLRHRILEGDGEEEEGEERSRFDLDALISFGFHLWALVLQGFFFLSILMGFGFRIDVFFFCLIVLCRRTGMRN